MTPESAPEREPAADVRASAAAETQASKAAAAGGPDGRMAGEPYTPLPEVAKRPRARWLVAAVLLLGLGAAGVLRHQAPVSVATAPAVQAAAEAVFKVSPQDFDAQATAVARRLLERDRQTHELDALAQRLLEQRASAATAPKEPSSPEAAQERQVLAALALAPQSVRQSIIDGSAGFYTFYFQELRDEGGDVWDIAVDGAAVARIVTSRRLTTLTIPLDPRTPHTITETLVFARERTVYVKQAPPGAPAAPANATRLSILSSQGEMHSRTMGPGDSQNWTVRTGLGR